MRRNPPLSVHDAIGRIADPARATGRAWPSWDDTNLLFRRSFIVLVLTDHRGNITTSAHSLGIQRTMLHRWIRKYHASPTALPDAEALLHVPGITTALSFAEAEYLFRRWYLDETLWHTRRNVTHAAGLMDFGRNYLLRLMRRYGFPRGRPGRRPYIIRRSGVQYDYGDLP